METNRNQKSKMAAGLLGLFFGGLGIHNFYLGRIARGVVQCLLVVIGAPLAIVGLGIPMLIGAGIWAFVESIIILTGGLKVDGYGVPLAA